MTAIPLPEPVLSPAPEGRAFSPGTTGWRASDLDDPAIERLWFGGRYEIIEGVLTTMAAAYAWGGRSLYRLIRLVGTELESRGAAGDFATEVDLILNDQRVVTADAVFLTPEDDARQAEACARAGRPDPLRARLLVPPTLVIESVSPGHESHDLFTKSDFYAKFGVPNYWVLDAFARTLRASVLEAGKYRAEGFGKGGESIRVSSFGGLEIPLERVWGG